jgi:signal transduction histidine kinase
MSTARRYWLVGSVVIIFLAALAVSVEILVSSALEAQRSQKDTAWSAAQLQIEYLQFEHAFRGYAGLSQSVPATYLETRLSMFRTRIRNLKQEAAGSVLALDPSYQQLIVQLDEAVAPNSPVVAAMESEDPAARRAALNRLARLDSPIRSWMQDVMLRGNPDRQRDDLVRAQLQAAGVMGVAIVAGIVLVVLLLRLIKRLEFAHEREREARWRIDQASRVKDTFLAVVTHELRTPLNAVIGFSELMKSRADQSADRELTAWVKEVLSAGRHLLTLINQTLDMSRIAAGKLALSPAEFDLRLLIEDSVASLQRQMALAEMALQDGAEPSAANVQLATRLPDEDLMIRADEAWLRQALFNVILHARKTSSNGSAITIAAATREGRAVIEVSHAMAADATPLRRASDEQRAELRGKADSTPFDPFLQGDLRLARETYGLGLELPIARAIVEAHDGELHYDAQAAQLQMRIDLPINLAA